MTETRNPKTSKLTNERVCSKINDDLLIEILVRLPLKPLFQFKSVCKHWNSIISDPKIHLIMRNQVHRTARGLILQTVIWNQPGATRVIVSLDDNPQEIHNKIPRALRISHSCNGLLLLKPTTLYPKHDNNLYCVYNPTTNQKTGSLLRGGEIIEAPVHGMYLAFDPSKSPHYKVVCLWVLDHRTNLLQLGVYSSETRSWEKRGRHVVTGYADFYKGVYWNRAINLISLFGKSIYLNPDDDDEMAPRAMPAVPGQFFVDSHFIEESCGHLHCAVFEDIDLSNGIRVYEMRRDYSEWFLKYRVGKLHYSQYCLKEVFGVVRCGGGDEDELVMGTEHGEIVSYNLVRKTFRTIPTAQDFYINGTTSFQYFESPCSV